jgi:hypothetical protein
VAPFGTICLDIRYYLVSCLFIGLGVEWFDFGLAV